MFLGQRSELLIDAASASEHRPRRSSGVRLAHTDPSGERQRAPFTPRCGYPNLHRSFRRAIASSVHTCFQESQGHPPPPPHPPTPPPHTHGRPKTCPMIAQVKCPGGQDGKGCRFGKKNGVSCHYSVRQKPGRR